MRYSSREETRVTTLPPETEAAPSQDPETEAAERPILADFVPEGGSKDPDEILDAFLNWVMEIGFELYEAQEEALLELMAGRHVILNTPTGSGKSLVAQGLHFKGLCEGKRSFYTSPIKALASEKFFALCDDFGAGNVGMLTGDASINPEASIICCTAEVLANMALRQGRDLECDYVVMDEFHYYADHERGVAWQIPLIQLPDARFLLMSATLGNTAPIAEKIEERSGEKVARIYSDERPVPLEFDYRETPIHQTVQDLFEENRAPIYIVNFTQRECAELAQALTSLKLATKEERVAIREAIAQTRFDTPYGKEFRRFLNFAIGVHHAGLLPKYRLLIEQLAQQGLVKVICGTDTLGVGVNVPIRTVLFTKLSKYDGRSIGILKVRDFKQIAGRAGRRGFDEKGWVVCQAPEHKIAQKKAARKAKKNPKKGKKKQGHNSPPPGFVSWNRETFEKLIQRPPETLKSRFRLDHGIVLNLIQSDAEADDVNRDNFSSLRELIRLSHEDDRSKQKLLSEAAVLVRSLNRAGILEMQRDTESNYLWVVVNEDLQWDFSLFQILSLYMVEAIESLDVEAETYALDLVSVVEAVLEDPRVVLFRQLDKAKGDLIARLKAEGVPYEERMNRLDEVEYPKPAREYIETTFDTFRRAHPWVGGAEVRCKSIGREMYENYYGFEDYVRLYGLHRSEGVLLRYLSQLYKTLSQSVPERARTEDVYDILGFFRTMIERIDTSLLNEWENLLHPELALEGAEKKLEARRELRAYELFHDAKAFAARIRAEMHELVRVLAHEEWEEATGAVRQDPRDSWTEERFQEALAPFLAEYGAVVFDHSARQAQNTRIEKIGPRHWEVSQVLVDPEGDNLWALQGEVDFKSDETFEGPLIRLRRIGP